MHRRPYCPRCERPQATCLCAWVRPCDNQVELLILQHPLEVRQAKGSATLLQLSLARCLRVVGEAFAPSQLPTLLTGDDCALLYPASPGASMWPDGAPPRRLVVLDGTWRKSRKLLHLNPALQALPRVALHKPPASRYGRLRKAHQADQLATLEAACLALQQLEQREAPYAALLEAFEGFVEAQARHRPVR